MFEFKHIQSFDKQMMDNPGPMVLFATPGMLHAGMYMLIGKYLFSLGMSLEVFKRWAPDPRNCLILPGLFFISIINCNRFCVEGTFGNIVRRKRMERMRIDKKDPSSEINVQCGVHKISFSAHADAKGILELISKAQPKNVM